MTEQEQKRLEQLMRTRYALTKGERKRLLQLLLKARRELGIGKGKSK
jgi:hypothetical protein